MRAQEWVCWMNIRWLANSDQLPCGPSAAVDAPEHGGSLGIRGAALPNAAAQNNRTGGQQLRWSPMGTCWTVTESLQERSGARECGQRWRIEPMAWGPIEAPGYLTFAQPGGHGFCWAGAEVNLRGMCYEHGTLPIDLGWYAPRIGPRTRQFNNVDLILELKPILERGLRPGVTER